MNTLTNTNNKSFKEGNDMNYNEEYLIVGNKYIINDGFVEDGWYYADGDWRFSIWATDEAHM